ncbi:ATP-dependent Clp protease, putative [Plasmodium ovale]|uniref:ATP-dependent Clp protease, putative n=1 Tax=Plasmodium ovale TaxID=36330 RepID=A0A1C3KXT4_PLAOA|nr:ATP-dependent Clp protease, putative [Plasmodium ovale]
MNTLYIFVVILILKIVVSIHIRRKPHFLFNTNRVSKHRILEKMRNYSRVKRRRNKLYGSIFDEYDEKCIKALIMAREVAKNDNKNEIMVKHILMAIIKIDFPRFEHILKYLNVSVTQFLEKFNVEIKKKVQHENDSKEEDEEGNISYNLNTKRITDKNENKEYNLKDTIDKMGKKIGDSIQEYNKEKEGKKILNEFIDKHIQNIEEKMILLKSLNEKDENMNSEDNFTDDAVKTKDINQSETNNKNQTSSHSKKYTNKISKENSDIKFSKNCKTLLQNALLEARKKKRIFVSVTDILISLINLSQESENSDFVNYLNEHNISISELKKYLASYDDCESSGSKDSNENHNGSDSDSTTASSSENRRKADIENFRLGNQGNEHSGQLMHGLNNEYLNQGRELRNNEENNLIHNNNFVSSSFVKDCVVDMVKLAEEKTDDDFFGRKKEIQRIIEILGRKKKSNPLLIGEAGVGKTAIVEQLSYLILKNKVPFHLKNCKIYQLNVGNIVAGTRYRGEFEEKMKFLLSNMNKKKKNILFIDEIHIIIGAGSGEGSLDASNLLKPFLSSDNLQCIGATTFQEYSKYIDRDKALRRRFNCVSIEPFTTKETYLLLKKIKHTYEKYHNVYYTNEALKSIIHLTDEYLPTSNFPDKAIDILDEAGVYQKIKYENFIRKKLRNERISSMKIPSAATLPIQAKKSQGGVELQGGVEPQGGVELQGGVEPQGGEELQGGEEPQGGVKAEWDNSDELSKGEINGEEIVTDASSGMNSFEERNKSGEKLAEEVNRTNLLRDLQMQYVTSDVIENIVSKKSSVSYIKKNKREEEKIVRLKEKLSDVIIGQEKVIDILSKYLFKAITNIKDPNKPIGTLLLCGTSGVGKTLCAQVISKYLFNENNLILINMSEYIDKYAVTRLFGSYPGYIGYREGGELTEKVKKKPFSIILFDEIEKAHKEVLNVLLQILDNGVLTDSKGNTVSFKNSFIFMTTNVGADIITDYFKLYNKNYSNLGFKYYMKNKQSKGERDLNTSANRSSNDITIDSFEQFEEKLRTNKWYEELQPEIEEELKKQFLPEFLNRIDEKIIFRQFLKRDIVNILQNMIKDLKRRMKKRKNLNLIIDQDVIKHICSDENNIYDMNYGARSIRRALYKYIEDPVASFLVYNICEPNDSIRLTLTSDNKIDVHLVRTSISQLSS